MMTMLGTSLVEHSYARVSELHMELIKTSKESECLRKMAMDDIRSYVDFAEWTDKIEKEGEIVYLLYCSDGIVALLIETDK